MGAHAVLSRCHERESDPVRRPVSARRISSAGDWELVLGQGLAQLHLGGRPLLLVHR